MTIAFFICMFLFLAGLGTVMKTSLRSPVPKSFWVSIGLCCVMVVGMIFFYSKEANAQPIVGTQVSYNTGEYSVIAQPESCDERTCWYTITVYTKVGVIAAMFSNNYALVEAVSPGCWKLQKTDEFMGLANLPNDAGPFMPLVICKREGLYYDGTDKELAPFLKERLDKILCATRDCRDARTCMNDVKMKALIVELHIIHTILWKSGWTIALPEGWHGGMDKREIGQLNIDVERILNIRFESHVPAARK